MCGNADGSTPRLIVLVHHLREAFVHNLGRCRLDFVNEEQIRRNRDSRAGWDLYTEHRQTVTALLTQRIPTAQGRLCLIGAGNCNDVDLKQLRNHFSEIHLLDLDREAIEIGCVAQGVDADPGIICHPPIDVTGILPLVNRWTPDTPAPVVDVAMAIQVAAEPNSFGIPLASFDVVASTGLLTQLVDQVNLTLGTEHPQFLELITTLRLRHLRLMLELLKPGGVSWLFTEVVSSLTCPELLKVPQAELMPLLTHCINQGNFFTGCNPAVLNQIYRQDPVLKSQVADLFVTRPWLWKFIYRSYAVVGIAALKNGQQVAPITAAN
jgi:hypothetical protein